MKVLGRTLLTLGILSVIYGLCVWGYSTYADVPWREESKYVGIIGFHFIVGGILITVGGVMQSEE